MLRDLGRGLRLLGVVLLIGFVLNFVWEVAQMPTYADVTGQPLHVTIGAAVHCLEPTLGDITTLGLAFVVGWAIHGTADWLRRLDWRDVVLLCLVLIPLATTLELVNVYLLRRWSYSPLMPILPIVQVGLLPTIQLTLLTLLTFGLTRRLTVGRARTA